MDKMTETQPGAFVSQMPRLSLASSPELVERWRNIAEIQSNLASKMQLHISSDVLEAMTSSARLFPKVELTWNDQMAQIAKSITEINSINATAAKKMRETLESAAKLSGFNEQIRQITLPRFEVSEWYSDLSDTMQRITERLRPTFEALRQSFVDFDWEGYEESYKAWGSYGWMIIDDLPLYAVYHAPTSLEEADSYMRGYFDKENLDRLFEHLRANLRRKHDLEDAIWLFQNRRYKPCAMVLFSLIDSRLMMRDRPERKRNGDLKMRQSSNALDVMLRDAPNECFRYYKLVNLKEAFDYFFKSGQDFDRTVEGEMNRNFIEHGMMYKRAKRLSCIKLFAMLDVVATMTKVGPITAAPSPS